MVSGGIIILRIPESGCSEHNNTAIGVFSVAEPTAWRLMSCSYLHVFRVNVLHSHCHVCCFLKMSEYLKQPVLRY